MVQLQEIYYGINGYCNFAGERGGFLESAVRDFFNFRHQNFAAPLAAHCFCNFIACLDHGANSYPPLQQPDRQFLRRNLSRHVPEELRFCATFQLATKFLSLAPALACCCRAKRYRRHL